MTQRTFLHTLSLPEHIWLNFFREFFSQPHLISDSTTGQRLPNRFFLNLASDVDNREFDVVLANDFNDANSNALPKLVIEDAAGATQLGLTISQVKTWHVTPTTKKDRADQVRFTYLFHALSKDRGESRMLAAIVSFAITVFREAILNTQGMVKIEPWSIGTTQPLRSDSGQDYFDTPVQVTFTTMEFWNQVEIGNSDAETFCVSFAPLERARFVRGHMAIRYPTMLRYIRAAMSLVNPTASRFVRMAMSIDAPLVDERFVVASLSSVDPLSSNRYVRASMRVVS